MVDYVVPFDADNPAGVILTIRPDVLVKGGDYQREDIVGRDIVPEVLVAPLVEGVSTSRLIERMRK